MARFVTIPDCETIMAVLTASQNGYTITVTTPVIGQAADYTVYLMVHWQLWEEIERLHSLNKSSDLFYEEYVNKLQLLADVLRQNKELLKDQMPEIVWVEPPTL